ncbi:MAG: hypothetical protein ACJAYR_003563 [Sneathiella sp.]
MLKKREQVLFIFFIVPLAQTAMALIRREERERGWLSDELYIRNSCCFSGLLI